MPSSNFLQFLAIILTFITAIVGFIYKLFDKQINKVENRQSDILEKMEKIQNDLNISIDQIKELIHKLDKRMERTEFRADI